MRTLAWMPWVLLAAAAPPALPAPAARQPVDWVDPLIGTSAPGLRWMMFPGPSMPFGMVKLSPDNREWRAGYNHDIRNIAGFSHIHDWTLGGLLMMPATGPLKTKRGTEEDPALGFRSRVEEEQAAAGYYAVTLKDYGIRAELTATTRAGFQRYTFANAGPARILMALDLPSEYGMKVKKARIRRVSSTEIEGSSEQANSRGFTCQEYVLHFVIRFSKPFGSMGGWVGDGIRRDVPEIGGAGDVGAFVEYEVSAGEAVNVQAGISLVSVEQARLNLRTEMAPFGWDFDAVRQNARKVWNALLGRIRVAGGTEADKTRFYTNLYRSYASRNIWSDVNGKYVDMFEKVRQLKDPESPIYSCDALWHTFWNLNQLWALMTPDIYLKWVNFELEMYDRGGWLARGPAAMEYTHVMVAAHEIALIAGAWQKGIRNFDVEKAFRAIRHQQTAPGRPFPEGGGDSWVGNYALEAYMKYGYVPVEDGPHKGNASLTLEYAYDDWCAAQLARALGKTADYEYFMKRAGNWRNAFHPQSGLMRPRHRDGSWLTPSGLFWEGVHFTEGNPWQYTFWVPHDMNALVAAVGKDEFNDRLRRGFEDSRPSFVGRYINMGNQPNMHAPWLFNYSGQPWNTQRWTREVMETAYGTRPENGYVGQEDQGQLAAWYAMSAMGLFQMDGGCSVRPIYEIGSPVFDRIAIHLDGKYYRGGEFIIEARNNSKRNVYIQSATLNGKPLEKPWFYHDELVKGGRLTLTMGPEPNRAWGSAPGKMIVDGSGR